MNLFLFAWMLGASIWFVRILVAGHVNPVTALALGLSWPCFLLFLEKAPGHVAVQSQPIFSTATAYSRNRRRRRR